MIVYTLPKRAIFYFFINTHLRKWNDDTICNRRKWNANGGFLVGWILLLSYVPALVISIIVIFQLIHEFDARLLGQLFVLCLLIGVLVVISFTSYFRRKNYRLFLDDTKIQLQLGLFNLKRYSIPLDQITSVKWLKRPYLEKISGTASLLIERKNSKQRYYELEALLPLQVQEIERFICTNKSKLN